MIQNIDSFSFLLKEITKDLNNINDTFCLFGIIYFFKCSYKMAKYILYCIKEYLIPFIYNNNKWIKNLGKWAIITDCSTNIGIKSANELALLNINLILICNDSQQLEHFSNNLSLFFACFFL